MNKDTDSNRNIEAIVIKEKNGTKIPLIYFNPDHKLVPIGGSPYSTRTREIVEEIRDLEWLSLKEDRTKKIRPSDRRFGDAVAEYCRKYGLPKAIYERI